MVLAAAVATLPLVGLVAWSAGNRYEADVARAKTRATTRAEIYAALLAESKRTTTTQSDLKQLRRVLPLLDGSVLEIFTRDGGLVATAGAAEGALGPADSRIAAAVADPSQTFDARGHDDVSRAWGFSAVRGSPLVVGFAIPGASVYGPSEEALARDVLMAFAAAALALVAAFLLAGYLTSPIRRLARRVGSDDDHVHDIGAIERGVDRMGETIEESQAELARRAERLQLVLDQRNQANDELRRLNEELEQRVAKRTRQLQDVNRELEAFSYSVSHDLRAPLRAIDGFSRILVDEHSEGLSVDALRYLSLVRRNTLRMGELIDGLLAFARLGHQPVEKRRIDVEVLAEELVAEELGHRNGHVVEIEVGQLPPADADPTLLRQVYANLLSNAVKYSAARDHAKIELGSFDADGRTVYFVRDNGVGFDMRYADKLFEVFQRLHTDGYDGTGLGLALAARIVARHGGAIWAESAPDEGATFFFTLEGGVVEHARR
jgi:signal transduction histidine kinase